MSDYSIDRLNLNYGTAFCVAGGFTAGLAHPITLVMGVAIAAAGGFLKTSDQLTPAANKDRIKTSVWDVANGAAVGGGIAILQRGRLPAWTAFSLGVLGVISAGYKAFVSINPYHIVAAPDSNKSKFKWNNLKDSW